MGKSKMNKSEAVLMREVISKLEHLIDTSKESRCGVSEEAKKEVRSYVQSWVLEPAKVLEKSLQNEKEIDKVTARRWAYDIS